VSAGYVVADIAGMSGGGVNIGEDMPMRIEDALDGTDELGPTADELNDECRLYQQWLDEQAKQRDDGRWKAGFRRYLSTPDGGRAA
jgi:hypothetical protein